MNRAHDPPPLFVLVRHRFPNATEAEARLVLESVGFPWVSDPEQIDRFLARAIREGEDLQAYLDAFDSHREGP